MNSNGSLRPGRRTASSVEDPLDVGLVQHRGLCRQPSSNPTPIDDVHIAGLFLDDERAWVHDDDYAPCLDWHSAGAAQDPFYASGLVSTLVDVGLPLAVHHEDIAGDPDRGFLVVLGV